MDLLAIYLNDTTLALVLCGLAGAIAYALLFPEQGIRRRLLHALGAVMLAVFAADLLAAIAMSYFDIDPERAQIGAAFVLGMIGPELIKLLQKRFGK